MPVTGVFDGAQGANDWSAIRPLKKGGANGKLHHKLMVLDEEVVIGGSFNYTGPANRLNDENIFVLGDLQTRSAAQRRAQKKIARFALAEIRRIIADHGRQI